MTILLILGGALVVLAVVLVSAAVGTTASGQAVSGVDRSVALVQALSSAPTELTKEYDTSFADRVMAPFQARAVLVARRLSGGDAAERIRRRLEVAGNPVGWTVERVQAGKVIGAIALFLISVALTTLMGASLTVRVVAIATANTTGWIGPNP
jgi:tight adherence protein C